MALRLTGPSLRDDAAPDPAALAARAALELEHGSIAAYGQLFEQAAQQTDPHRRYRARTMLLDQGYAACMHVSAGRAREIYTRIARQAIKLLEENPLEPVILNSAGVAFYELWSLDAAEALFGAALRLDPGLRPCQGNLAAVAARRKRRGGAAIRTAASVTNLEPRVSAITKRARPPRDLRLSLCMIVRDEEEMLPRCLAAAAPAVDEIIVVDTGSQDSTIEIARQFGAQVIEFAWTGSFSDARNVSFEAATGDWVMYLDADEVLVAEDVEKLRALTGHTWREAFYFVETNFTGDITDGTAVTHNALRMFRNRPEYRFDGRLHEQIGNKLPGYLPDRIEQTSVRLEHYGYLGVVRDAKEKSRRNIELLLKQQQESPPSAFLHFNLGSEYAAAGDGPAALREFEEAWAMAEREDVGTYEFTPSLVARLVKSLRVCGRPADAIERARDGLARFPNFTDLVFEQATASLALGQIDEAIAYYERCIELGDAPVRYTATVGCGTYLPRIALAELHLNRREHAQARALLDWCLEHHPSFFGTVLPYAAVLLASGTDPLVVVAEIERRVERTTPTIRFMLGTALFEAGAGAAAEQQYRLVLEAQPHNPQARVALAEVLLYQRKFSEGAQVAADADTDSPLAAMAVRSEACGRILAGEPAAIAALRGRALAARLPEAEVELFEAWARLELGDAPGVRIRLEAVGLLAAVLEALLRVHAFESFEKLVGLLRDSELATREQRELLAMIYLRRGFAASAAEEWMAVCAERPDVRALVGLARVAAARGMPENVVVFATKALELDAGNGAARALADAAQAQLARLDESTDARAA
ncbi:MAG: glycosyltransferase [Solirubrobacteraceae bacterium]|jgi:glycosyltransferase involved in cell wall biosynthesis